jgi:ArsR family transcriptional regulator, arsenate/arsenite/antimonite-responsive transcriptional repressor
MKDVAQFFKVLADEARLKMLWLLFNNEELCVCDIMETLGITQSKASRHLATLRHAGLVTDRRVGAWSYYSLCTVEDELGRTQLDTLRAGLATHPGAAEVLRALKTWLKGKQRNSCGTRGTARKESSHPRTAGGRLSAEGAR